MNRQQVIDQMKSRYQIDPCRGSQWVETDDIEMAVAWACIKGRGYLKDYVITWSENAGYQFQKDAQ